MTHAIISKDEVSALLEGFGVEDAPARLETQTDATGEVMHRLVDGLQAFEGALPTLEPVHRNFAQALAAGLSGLMGRQVTVSALESAVQVFGQWHLARSQPIGFFCLESRQPPGSLYAAFGDAWLKQYVDLYFGGTGDAAGPQGERQFSPVEMRAVSRLINTVCDRYSRAWGGRCQIESGSRVAPQRGYALELAVSTKSAVFAKFRIDIGPVQGDLWIVIPGKTLDLFTNSKREPDLQSVDGQSRAWPRSVRGLADLPVASAVDAKAEHAKAMVADADVRNFPSRGVPFELSAGDALYLASSDAQGSSRVRDPEAPHLRLTRFVSGDNTVGLRPDARVPTNKAIKGNRTGPTGDRGPVS